MSTGEAGTALVLRIDPDQIATAPNTTVVMVTITSDGALNSPITLPVAVRKTSTFQLIQDGGTVTEDDRDGDGVADAIDNCPDTANADQADSDGDGFGDVCDPFPMCANCGPMGLTGYAFFFAGYGTMLSARRRRPAA